MQAKMKEKRKKKWSIIRDRSEWKLELFFFYISSFNRKLSSICQVGVLSVSTPWAAKSSRFSTRFLQFCIIIPFIITLTFCWLLCCLCRRVSSQTKANQNWYQRPAISLQLLLSHIISIQLSVASAVFFLLLRKIEKNENNKGRSQRMGWNEGKIKQSLGKRESSKIVTRYENWSDNKRTSAVWMDCFALKGYLVFECNHTHT